MNSFFIGLMRETKRRLYREPKRDPQTKLLNGLLLGIGSLVLAMEIVILVLGIVLGGVETSWTLVWFPNSQVGPPGTPWPQYFWLPILLMPLYPIFYSMGGLLPPNRTALIVLSRLAAGLVVVSLLALFVITFLREVLHN